MGIMSSVTSVAINTTSLNVLAGLLEEFVTRPSIITVYANAARQDIDVTIIGGGAVVVDAQELSDRNASILKPDDLVYQFALTGPNDRLVMRFINRNVAAGPDNVRWVVEVQPVA